MRGLKNRWYPVSLTGKIIVVAYAFVPPYIAYAQTTEVFPPELQSPLVVGMILVLICMLVCKVTGQKPFRARHRS